MKKFLKTALLLLLTQSILMGQAFSATRVDSIIKFDQEEQISVMLKKKEKIRSQQEELENIELHLRHTKKGQSIYLRIETIAGSLIAVGIVIGSYKAYFPPGFRAMLGAYVTVTGISRGLIKLSNKEVTLLLEESRKLSEQLLIQEEFLDKQLISICGKIKDHWLCEYL